MSPGMNSRSYEIRKDPKHRQKALDIFVQIDARFAHLLDSTLQRQPYLLSVPSDVPYRHSSRFVNTWYEGTPFDRAEEQLQYISFLPHQGDHESLLKVEGQWWDDSAETADDQEQSPRAVVAASGANTPSAPANRKKISLRDYKKKGPSPSDLAPDPSRLPKSNELKTNQEASKPPPPPGSELSSSRHPTDSPSQEKPTRQIAVKAPPPAKPREHKQSAPSTTIAGPPIAAAATVAANSSVTIKNNNNNSSSNRVASPSPVRAAREDSPRPPKRRRLSPPFDEPRPVKSPAKVDGAAMKMPRLLSPTLPSPEKKGYGGLPELLSPVLPPALMRAIATPPPGPKEGSVGHRRSDSVRSILAQADLENSPSSNRLAPPGNRMRSESQHSARSSAPGSPNPAKIALAKSGGRVATPAGNSERSTSRPRQRHTIILKYGKKNRKRVEALLKFAPRKKEASKSENLETGPAGGDADPVSKVNSDSKPEKKRKADENPGPSRPEKPRRPPDELDRPEKKRKIESSPDPPKSKPSLVVESSKRPTTPIPPPVAKPPSSGKTTFSTPRKELKSTAMRRVESSDGLDAPTPGDKVKPKPSPQPASSASRDDERKQWLAMNEKFFALGRSLKHEGSALHNPANGEPKSSSAKGVVLLIEALVCFMINIAAQSYARPSADVGREWRSIIPYHIFVFRASRKHSHLHGLVVQLGAICRQLVHKYDMDRLAKDPLPDEYCNSAPTPGSDGNTRTTEDGEKYKKRYVEFRDDLVANARELQTAWLNGSRLLGTEILSRDYPKTWAGRTRDMSSRATGKLSIEGVGREYYLPMDSLTTAFEAGGFAIEFLAEWCAKEGVDWQSRIEF